MKSINMYKHRCVTFLLGIWICASCNQRAVIPTPKMDPYESYYLSYQHISNPSDSLKIVGYDGNILKINYIRNGTLVQFSVLKSKDSTFRDRNITAKIFSGLVDTLQTGNAWIGAKVDFDTLMPGIQNFMSVQTTVFGINKKAMLGLKSQSFKTDTLFFF